MNRHAAERVARWAADREIPNGGVTVTHHHVGDRTVRREEQPDGSVRFYAEARMGPFHLVDRIQHLVPTPDGGDDFVGIGCPVEGLRI